jgi:hypothetical protein
MSRLANVFWFLSIILLLALLPNFPASAAAGGVVIPPGFRKIDSTFGIELYEKDYPGGSPDYVQVVDLSQGASLKLLHGNITETRAGIGPYGGNDARFRSETLAAYWQDLSSQDATAFCVVNGQFFYMLEYPTRLPFPLKTDGQILTDGYGIQDFPDQKLMLELWPGKADIVALSKEALYASTAPNIIAGLTEDAPKAKKRYTGRTFIGLTGQNSQGTYETLMVFNTQTARQVDAAEVLKSFGAQKVMMLDGGGSTQLLCRGKSYIYSDRLVPQAIGIIAGSPGKVQTTLDNAGPQAPLPDASSGSGPAAGAATSAAVEHVSQDKSGTPSVQTQPQKYEQTATTIQLDPPGQNQTQRQAGSPRQITEQLMLPILFNSASIPISPASQTSAANLDNRASPTVSPQPSTVGIQGPVESLPTPAPSAQILAAGITPVHLDDVLWVPASMAPVVLFLLLVIFKFHSRQG